MPEALRLSLQIAEAIEAAHEKGIVHRDLKPANIKVTADGKVKVLDFGLAKAWQAEAGDVGNSPTLSMAATAQGIILGTAAYMAPEQARGQAVDHRADIWAFGCVLFEMLTGRQTFRGDLVSDILASVLAREPEFAELPPTIAPRLKDALQRCLEKNPKRRWQAIGDLRVELERILANPNEGLAPAASVASTPRAGVKAVLPYAAAAAIVAAAGAWMLKPAPAPEPRPLVRFEFEVPQNPGFRGTGRPVLAFSPDGRHFAYNTPTGVFLRSMDTLTSRLVPGTEPGVDDAVLFSRRPMAGVLVERGDGAAEDCDQWWSAGDDWPCRQPIRGDVGSRRPDSLRAARGHQARVGQRRFTGDGDCVQGRRRGARPVPLARRKDDSLHADPRRRRHTLGSSRSDRAGARRSAQSADPRRKRRRCTSQPGISCTRSVTSCTRSRSIPIGSKPWAGPSRSSMVFSARPPQRRTRPAANYGLSDRGDLVYLNTVTAAATPETTLGIADRNGGVRLLDMPKANYRNPRVSPNGRSIAVETITAGGQSVVWVYDLSGTSAIRRLTQEGNNSRPVWTPDGKRIAYGSDREKAPGIYWQLADGSGLPERLTTAEDGSVHYPQSFSPDGKVLSFANVRGLGAAAWGVVDDAPRCQ